MFGPGACAIAVKPPLPSNPIESPMTRSMYGAKMRLR